MCSSDETACCAVVSAYPVAVFGTAVGTRSESSAGIAREAAISRRYCVISERSLRKAGSWFTARRSRGRSMSTRNWGPSVAAGAGVKGIMRSASNSASSTSLVTSTMVRFSRRRISSSSSCMLARVSASRADSGSSSSRISGRVASARASATLWRIPPDNSDGRRSMACASPTMDTKRRTSAERRSRDNSGDFASTARPTFPATVNQGKSE